MFECLPVDAVLQLSALENYETCKARGLLRESDDNSIILVISHQWLSEAHPDPQFEQFPVLQKALLYLMNNNEVRSDSIKSFLDREDMIRSDWHAMLSNALVWYDYCCNPAGARLKLSPLFSDAQTMTLFVTPTIERDSKSYDVFSWRDRGWCRAELLQSHLKPNAFPSIVCSEDEVHFYAVGHYASHLLVGEGDFWCCANDHMHDSHVIACEKSALYPVLRAKIRDRILYEQSIGNKEIANRFLAHEFIWMSSFAEQTPVCLDESRCLRDESWSDLRLACLGGNVLHATRLVEEGVDVNDTLQVASEQFGVEKGATVITHLAQFCCTSQHEEILDLLISAKANLFPHTHGDVLTQASMSFSKLKRGARWLLMKFPEWDVNHVSVVRGLDRWPLFSHLTIAEDLSFIKLLMEHKADPHQRDKVFRFSPLMVALLEHSNTEMPDIAGMDEPFIDPN